jgi:hypothetical protein
VVSSMVVFGAGSLVAADPPPVSLFLSLQILV